MFKEDKLKKELAFWESKDKEIKEKGKDIVYPTTYNKIKDRVKKLREELKKLNKERK